MKCPHCGSAHNYRSTFSCGTRKFGTGFIQSNECKRVSRLIAAGQDAVDYCDGKHAMLGRVLDGWRKATE